MYLSTTFVPDRPFQYFTIANFFPDEETATDMPQARHQQLDKINAGIESSLMRTKRVAYVCLDDVSVSPDKPIVANEPDTPKSLETTLLTERKFTFSAGVLFDSGKSDLRREAQSELDSLAAFLKKHPRTRIGISGHTDDVGADASNQQLSEARAKAVYQALQNAGANAGQLQWKGYGEKMPLVPNDCDVNRQKNRRVTIRGI